MVTLENISKGIGFNYPEEIVQKLASTDNVRIERIMSPESDVPSHVYDQDEGELVVLEHGYAELEFTDSKQVVKMRRGDYINIEPHLKHRVLRTIKGTSWLCVFYK